MSKYEVIATVWDSDLRKQTKVVIGEFDKYINAKLFADAYAMHYSSKAEIVEYKRA